MIKTSGLFLVFISCFFIGLRNKKRKQIRINELENMLSCIKVFDNEIRYSLNDIEQSFSKMSVISAGVNHNIFNDVCMAIKNNCAIPVSQIWRESTVKRKEESCYNDDDIKILLEFGHVLGAGDVDTQMKNIEDFKNNLSTNINSAKLKYKETGDLYLKLGVYAGVMLVIFFI